MRSIAETNSSPALDAFLAQLKEGQTVGQVLVEASGRLWKLRHAQDRGLAEASLRQVHVEQLRGLAQSTAEGAFRPLKSAPNLARGWWAQALSAGELGTALEHLYPGFLADWHVWRTGASDAATDFRSYAERQTGMYRIVAMLGDEQAARAVRAHCAPRFCLKCRAWSVSGLAPEAVAEKSVIPCLEPCALLLEFARKAMRLEQSEAVPLQLPAEEWEAVRQCLRAAVEKPDPKLQEADFSNPLNPRRLQLTLEKLRSGNAEKTS